MAKTKKPHQEENDDSGAAVVLLAIGATAGLWAWLRLRERQPASLTVPFARSQAQSNVVATNRSSQFVDRKPQFGYTDRARFGFAF